METLYKQLKEAESIDASIQIIYDDADEKLLKLGVNRLPNPPVLDIQKVQRNLMMVYESNPVLDDAIQGKVSIEETLNELAQINTGIGRVLPWRKNKAHNEKLDKLGELVSKPFHLETRGLLYPDNFINWFGWTAAISFTTGNIASKFITDPVAPYNLNLETELFNNIYPMFMTLVLGGLGGINQQYNRSYNLPVEQARYIDQKVREFYK